MRMYISNYISSSKPTFESGVVNIQDSLKEKLSKDKKQAVSMLREIGVIRRCKFIPLQHLQWLKKRKPEITGKEHINCDLILGSVSEVERLRSISKYVFTENRKNMTPQLFVETMFLKVNQRFWDAHLVSKGIYNAHEQK